MKPPMNARTSQAGRGFTLIETMIVVVIISILATLATFGVRRYIRSAKTAEASQMIGSIKAGQEAYYDETFGYLNVSGSLDTYYPDVTDLSVKVQWDPGSTLGQKFASIGVAPSAAVNYRYSTISGSTADPPASFGKGGVTSADYGFSASPGAPWYIVKALGDLDGDAEGDSCPDGTCAVFIGSSQSNLIYMANEDE